MLLQLLQHAESVNDIKDCEILGFKLNIVNFNQTNFSYKILAILPPVPSSKIAFYLWASKRQQWAMEREMPSQQWRPSDSWAVISLEHWICVLGLAALKGPPRNFLPSGSCEYLIF